MKKVNTFHPLLRVDVLGTLLIYSNRYIKKGYFDEFFTIDDNNTMED